MCVVATVQLKCVPTGQLAAYQTVIMKPCTETPREHTDNRMLHCLYAEQYVKSAGNSPLIVIAALIAPHSNV